MKAAGEGKLQALAHLRVLEFTAGMAGPWIGRHMAHCGADVVRVESMGHPDVVRLYVSPRAPEKGTQPDRSPWFTDWNAGKRFVALDLTKPAAVDLCKRLVAHCDIVVDNYSVGVLAKLGLDYEELRHLRPDVIMIGSSGLGATGPHRGHVTWGPNIEARAGLARESRQAGRDFAITQYAYPDPLSALHGLFAVLCALDYRQRTGEGQFIDLSQLEVTVAALGPSMMRELSGQPPARVGDAATVGAVSPHDEPHGCYPCRGDDRWCAISVRSDAEWGRLSVLAEHPEWAEDLRFATTEARSRHHTKIDDLLAAWTRELDAYALMDRLQRAGIAAGVVQNVEDLAWRDEQLAARGFFEEIPHRDGDRVLACGLPLGLTGTPGRTRRTGGRSGEDNEAVLHGLLGLSEEEVAELVRTGAVQTGASELEG